MDVIHLILLECDSINKIQSSNSTYSRRGDCNLFNLYEQVCKRRVRLLNTKSPSTRVANQQKPYKHLELLEHAHIKRLLDFNDPDSKFYSLIVHCTYLV